MLDRPSDKMSTAAAPTGGSASQIGDAGPWRDTDGTSLVGTMHLVLAVTSLIAVFVDGVTVGRFFPAAWLIFFGFTAHTVIIYLLARRAHPAADSRVVLWLDILWYALLVYVTGANNSLFFMFFFFSILISAFRFGFDEGARITLAAAALYSLTALATVDSAGLVQVLLRTAFMLALGYMMASWGESNLGQQRALALLRDVSRLSNPRFGIEQTTRGIMQRCRAYFDADTFIVLSHKPGSHNWTMRTVSAEGERSVTLTLAEAASLPPLMALPAGPVLYNRPALAGQRWSGQFAAYDGEQEQWQACPGEDGEHVADLLEARAFISAPLSFLDTEGRVFAVASRHGFRKPDALFLCHVLAQVVPVLENIHLLDRLASDAALQERQAISRDLHDSTVQPYIGLSHTIAALNNKAAPDNPLKGDIAQLAAMAAEVVAELRRFAGGFARPQPATGAQVLAALRQHLEQVRQFYGLDIAFEPDAGLDVGDRLAASMFQLVCEGVANIRKHSAARHGRVRIACRDGQLTIDIENDGTPPDLPPFTPASISQRSAALGGSVRIERRAPATTAVCIAIPV